MESITVTADGRYEVFFDDGDIFAGHVIIVSGTFYGGPTDAQIAGSAPSLVVRGFLVFPGAGRRA